MKQPVLCALFVSFAMAADAANWPTYRGDPQRTGWQKDEAALNVGTVGGLRLLWRLKIDNVSIGLNSLTAPTIVERVITHHGFQELVFVAGSSGIVYAVDADLGTVLWKRQLPSQSSAQASDPCSAGLTATPVFKPVSSAAAAEDDDNDLSSLNPLYVLSASGDLFGLRPINGSDLFAPASFLQAKGTSSSLTLFGNSLYTGLSSPCHKASSGLWAKDVSGSKLQDRVSSYLHPTTGQAEIAIGSSGSLLSIYRSRSGEGLLSFSEANLTGNPAYKLLNSTGAAEPRGRIPCLTAFDWKGKHLVSGVTADERPFLVDEQDLKPMVSDEPAPELALQAAQALPTQAGKLAFHTGVATWEDTSGTRWIYLSTENAASSGRVQAFRLIEQAGRPKMQLAWTREGMRTPSPPVVANGVLYVLSTGEFTGVVQTASERVARSRPAVLYALDAANGKQLFASGGLIGSFDHSSGLAVANGHVCFGTWDNNLYCFGLPIDF